jgi:CheY-like chemotaxis protein
VAEPDIPPVVLVVDDDDVLRDVYGVALKAARLSPRLAEDGETAVRFLETEIPDAVICDMSMAGMSGLSVIEAIRSTPRTRAVPVVAVSAISPSDDLWALVQPKWDRYIQKPADLDQLVAVTKELIAQRRDGAHG